MQLATNNKQIYIIDVVKLCQSPIFVEFINSLFENKNITKIGHSIQNDFSEMKLNINLVINPQNFVDLVELYNEVSEKKVSSVSLTNQLQQFLGKKKSKREAFSNWEGRPLRKVQLHYAAVDAYACILVYEKLNKFKEENINITGVVRKQKMPQKTVIRVGDNFRYA